MLMKILDYFFLLRPTLFFTGITIYLLSTFPENPPFQFILSIIIFQGIIYLYNQLHDIETDKINNKLFFIADDIISKRNAELFYYFLLILLIVILFFTNLFFFLTIATGVILLNYCYSHPMINWKGKPLLSVLSAFWGGCLGFLSGYFTSQQELSMAALYMSIPSGLAVMTAAVLGMVLDYHGDMLSGKNTIAVYLGLKKTRYLIFITTCCGLIISLLLSEIFFLFSFLGCLLLQIILPNQTEWQLKTPILILALSACWYYPVYILFVLGYYLIARCYYKYRFNLKYP